MIRPAVIIGPMTERLDDEGNPCVGRPAHRLLVYVTSECFSCQEAVLLAAQVTRHFPQIITEIINLDDPCSTRPDCVFAVPTYLLDGKVVGLGNPYREQLFARIMEVLSIPA